MEDCPFNNSDEVYCIDNNDLTHCLDNNTLNCSDHVCVDFNCGDGNITGNEECEIGGMGCRGCVCMKGWYSNHSNDCFSQCGDGNLTSDEECEVGDEGCDDNCTCGDGWVKGGIDGIRCVGMWGWDDCGEGGM